MGGVRKVDHNFNEDWYVSLIRSQVLLFADSHQFIRQLVHLRHQNSRILT